MNFENIEQLIKLVKENELKKFKYKDYEHEIELDFTEENAPVASMPAGMPQGTADSAQAQSSNEDQSTSDDSEGQEVKAQMVGTFYLQEEKELTDPIIKVGDQVKSGDVIGYIEAMKVMNEVTSDVDGEVTDILVEHGSNVEYDQPIIRVK
ncbi:acetyl-CoA carboxylase biotin carboxyl carrier protein [Staphylococcus pettenkoferi]|uniref:acetyl-CoA carboxylase biotin carboxyl carrier protein n=1 Tax=Staphylococcus pettenkoferi TaxID=170573 RepID=UPI0002432B3D|nr:biotin/lipoyl-containing protein [Staphylococcus pettenkoferi]ASE36220.1 acetyl-CoA carboxylase biotin carboxyl carrier protein subunit [Staphylococcus pettenkoferi]EHM72193.1 putative acetyl-CoA carboxylase, biotin carboxyl carrier protein [Staphylococcus pettenkoferi VCU012]MCY1620284.1 acetyl-CoA carboxylase biotin carboxyl carrier protein subunit [Staphylococcus pettenkoferi]